MSSSSLKENKNSTKKRDSRTNLRDAQTAEEQRNHKTTEDSFKLLKAIRGNSYSLLLYIEKYELKRTLT